MTSSTQIQNPYHPWPPATYWGSVSDVVVPTVLESVNGQIGGNGRCAQQQHDTIAILKQFQKVNGTSLSWAAPVSVCRAAFVPGSGR